MTAGQAGWQALRLRRPVGARPDDAARLVLEHFSIQQPPVDVAGIVRSLGIKLEFVFSTWSGAVSSNDAGAVIWIRSTDARVRQRFTIAHELGHLMLHELGVAFRDDTFTGSWMETQANAFAGELLIPTAFLRPLVHRKAKPLSKEFGVSEFAMKIALSRVTGRPVEQF